jgi:hypothetical protein
MAQSIGAKPWWNINTGYYQVAGGRKTFVPTTVTYRGYTVVPNNALCWQARHPQPLGGGESSFSDGMCTPLPEDLARMNMSDLSPRSGWGS